MMVMMIIMIRHLLLRTMHDFVGIKFPVALHYKKNMMMPVMMMTVTTVTYSSRKLRLIKNIFLDYSFVF